MTRLVKIVDNKYVQIEEYRNPNICFNTNEYSDFENYCTLRETFDPFRVFYENQELENHQKEFIKYLEDEIQNKREKSITLTAFIRNVVPLQQCLQKYKEIVNGTKRN